jgi:hypothetical protein
VEQQRGITLTRAVLARASESSRTNLLAPLGFAGGAVGAGADGRDAFFVARGRVCGESPASLRETAI